MTNNTDVNIKVFTCVFVLDEENDRILLGYKKRGLLEKKWNGFGGKVEPGETILAAAERELEEECGLKPIILFDNGILTVEIEGLAFVARVHLFTTNKYAGTITESNEMVPKWFNINEIPFEDMCHDHKFWLPLVIKNRKLNVYFKYDSSGKVLDRSIEFIDVV